MATPQKARGEGEGELADLFDYGALKDYLGFVVRGMGRHPYLALAVFTLTATLATTGAVLYPKTYRAQSKILAQRNQVMASLGNPGRSMPWDHDAPTRAAQEMVLRRDNLVSLVQQTKLIERWESTRTPLHQVKDQLMALLRGPMAEEDKLDAMVGMLEKRLRVSTEPSTVSIQIDFPHAQMAYGLIEAAQQNFLENQHVLEVSAISETISILEIHASQAHDSIETALQRVVRLRAAKLKGSPHPGPEPLPTPAASAYDAEVTQLRFLIRAKRRAIVDLEEFRARRLTELNTQLAEQKVQYSSQHPVVVDTAQRVLAMQQESPQVMALRREEAALVAEYTVKGGRDPETLSDPNPYERPIRRLEGLELSAIPSLNDDPEVAFAEARLRTAQGKYDELLMRIDAARIELDTARAAFKYRFSILNPAQLPKQAIGPNVPLLVLSGMAVALLLAVLTGAVVDLWRGRVIEPWQIQRSLGLPVLGEVGRR